MRKLKILFLSILAILCFSLGVGCSKEELQVELLEPAFRPDVYVNQEFDVVTVLDEPNEKYEYEILECFYLDNSLERFEIPFNGTTFTQSLGYDVFITLQIKYRRQVKILEFELATYIEQTAIQEAYLNSYSAGTQKLMSVDPEYLIDGETTAVKVTINSVGNSQSEGTQSGAFNFKARNNTTWDNVVITTNVFNTYDRDIMIGLYFYNDKGILKNTSMLEEPILCKSGEWTKASWSLRALGLNYDLIREKVSVAVRTLIPNTVDKVAPWRYTFYLCGLDICDYSQEKFPDLDTRTLDERAEDSTVDANDVYLQTHNRALGTVVLSEATTYTSATVEKYASATVAKPTGLENSKSFVKYNVSATKPNSTRYVATPFNFKKGYVGNIVSENELALYSATNWKNAFVGMWVYNDSDIDVSVKAKTVSGKSVDLKKKQWTYVEYSLAQVYGITTNVFAQDDYSLRMYFASASTGMDTLETYKNYNVTLYVDGFDIYNKTPNSYDTSNQAFVGSAMKNHETGYTYFYTNVEVSEDSSVKYNGENSIKYTATDDGRSPNASRRYFAPMVFDDLNPFSALLSTYHLSYSDLSAESRVRFYIKNDSAHKLRFIWMQGSSINLNRVNSEIQGGTPYVDVLANSDWTKVDLPLRDVYEALISSEERVHLCAGFLSTGNPFTAQTYYMSGFEVYTPSAEDIIASYATGVSQSADWYKAGVANAQTDTLQDEKVFRYDVSIGPYSANVAAVTKGMNVMANMFVAKSNMPSELLSVCNVTETSWTKMTISFMVYSNVDVGFSAFYSLGGTGTIGSTSNAQQECTAGEWSTVTFELDITSATFITDYNLVIVGRSFCAGTTQEWQEVGKHAYTYYVKGFNITVS